MPQNFEYIPRNGVYYAQSFALIEGLPESQRLFFYDPGDDCTNFISQCVWAAYGGWLPGFTEEAVAKNAQRILSDTRQVKGAWFGSKKHIGSNRWCRVEEFYSYVTTRGRPAGPVAQLLADGDFNSVNPAIIRPGDVIQLVVTTYTPERFGHGLYVTAGAGDWANVRICCHTYNRLNAPMTEFSSYPDIYTRLRVLRFSPATFEL